MICCLSRLPRGGVLASGGMPAGNMIPFYLKGEPSMNRYQELRNRQPEEAKTIASGKEIEWFDAEITGMTAERMN